MWPLGPVRSVSLQVSLLSGDLFSKLGHLLMTDHERHVQSSIDNLAADVRGQSVRRDSAALVEQGLHGDVGGEHDGCLGAEDEGIHGFGASADRPTRSLHGNNSSGRSHSSPSPASGGRMVVVSGWLSHGSEVVSFASFCGIVDDEGGPLGAPEGDLREWRELRAQVEGPLAASRSWS